MGFNTFLWCCSHMTLPNVEKIKGAVDKNGLKTLRVNKALLLAWQDSVFGQGYWYLIEWQVWYTDTNSLGHEIIKYLLSVNSGEKNQTASFAKISKQRAIPKEKSLVHELTRCVREQQWTLLVVVFLSQVKSARNVQHNGTVILQTELIHDMSISCF